MRSALKDKASECIRHKPEVADIFRLYGEQYCREHPMPPSHHTAVSILCHHPTIES
jgi:hypothetical protein